MLKAPCNNFGKSFFVLCCYGGLGKGSADGTVAGFCLKNLE